MRIRSALGALGFLLCAAGGAEAAAFLAPTGLKAEPANTTVGLTWTAPDGLVNHYVVYIGSTLNAKTTSNSNPAYVAIGLNNGTAYTFTVAAVDSLGAVGDTSAPVTAVPAVLPDAPAGLTASVTNAPTVQIQLNWNAVSPQTAPVTGYAVYRSITPTPQDWKAAFIATAGTTAYLDVDAALNTTSSWSAYYYRVAAIDQLGNTGLAAGLAVPLQGAGAPGAPVAPAALALDGLMELSWTQGGATTPDAYAVYYSLTPGVGETMSLVPGSNTATSIALPNDGQKYSFSVAAVQGGLFSSRASVQKHTLPPPASGLAVFSGNGYDRLSWNASPESAGVTAYVIYLDVSPTPQIISAVIAPELSYVNVTSTALTNFYRVAPQNDSGSNLGSAVGAVSNGALPSTPAGLKLEFGLANKLAVSWKLNPVEDAVTDYGLTITALATSNTVVALALPAGTSATAIGSGQADIINGGIYQISLTSTNAAGVSTAAVTVTAAMSAPSGLSGRMAGSGILLSWVEGTAPTGAVYNLYRTNPNTSAPFLVTTTAQAFYMDPGLEFGAYAYQLLAQNALGQLMPDSPASNISVTFSGPPAPPGKLQLFPGNGQAQILWQTVANAGSYNLYRSNTSGAYGSPLLQGIEAKSTSQNDTLLTNGTPYFYTLSAVNDAGESTRSAESRVIPFAPAQLPANQTIQVSELRRSVSLKWNASLHGDYSIIGYNLYRSTDGGGTFLPIGNSPTVSSLSTTISSFAYVDPDVQYGDSYYYLVKPVDYDAAFFIQHEGPAYAIAVAHIVRPENEIMVFRNAFNPARGEKAPIQLTQVQPGKVWIKIYNLAGEYIRTILDTDVPAGYTPAFPYLATLSWDGKNERGETVASGVYMIHAEGQSHYHQTRKVAVIK